MPLIRQVYTESKTVHMKGESTLNLRIIAFMGNFSLNRGIPGLADAGDATCFARKQGVETVNHFLLECPGLKGHFDSPWNKLKTKVTCRYLNPVHRDGIVNFITNLAQNQNASSFTREDLQLPFDNITTNSIKRYVAAAVGTICNIRTEKLRELRLHD